MTSWSSVSCSANSAKEESVGDFWSELSFVLCTTSHVGLCKGSNDSHPQPNSDLAQLAEHETDDLEIVSSNPTRATFDEIYFVRWSDDDDGDYQKFWSVRWSDRNAYREKLNVHLCSGRYAPTALRSQLIFIANCRIYIRLKWLDFINCSELFATIDS